MSEINETVDLAKGSSRSVWDVEGVGGDVLMSSKYRSIFAMFPGLEERVMTVVTPAEVARRAATILLDIPPVPRFEPVLDTASC